MIERYIINTVFAGGSGSLRSFTHHPQTDGGGGNQSSAIQQRAEALLQKHRTMDSSLLMREAKSEIMLGY